MLGGGSGLAGLPGSAQYLQMVEVHV